MKFLAMATAVAAASTAVIVATVVVSMAYHTHEPEREVIYVQESPPPTTRMTTPTTKRTPASRAGKARVKAHRAGIAMWYNFRHDRHWAYEAVIKAAEGRVSMRAIITMRDKVASALYHAVINDKTIAGIRIKDLMVEKEMTLESYLQATCACIWASQVETTIAAQMEKAPIIIKTKYAIVTPNPTKQRFVLLLKNSHYYVQRMHKTSRHQPATAAISRAGMRQSSWTDWQQELTWPQLSSSRSKRHT